MTDESLHLRNTALAITERCNLRCKLCMAYIPYHVNPRDMTTCEVERVMDRYFNLVSSVDVFCITGGEPLLNKNLIEILKVIDRYDDKINKTLDITTNGSFLFTHDVLNFIETHLNKIRIIVSDYGLLSPKAKMLEDLLIKRGIPVRVERHSGVSPLYGGWIDCRDHSLKHFSQREVDEQGRRCHHKNKQGFVIRKGELHNCARSYWRMMQGIIPRNSFEYIDLLDNSISIETQRESLKRMKASISVKSCSYCYGAEENTKRYPPAEQL